MASIGNLYIGGKDTTEPDMHQFQSGIAFPLKDRSEVDYIWNPEDSGWQVELKKEHDHVVARSRQPRDHESLVTSGLEQIQRCLDIISVKKKGIFVLHQPELNHVMVFQRNVHTVLRYFSVVTLAISINVAVEVRDKNGNIKPTAPVPEPTWTWAFRYYRMSQASHNIFDAYRNLFLSLEALLNEICPKRSSEGEKEWLGRALSEVATRVKLASYMPDTTEIPVDYFIRTQYENLRCRLFHAKYPDTIIPHEELNPTDILAGYETLLSLWRDITATYFNVSRAGGVFTYQGFKSQVDRMFGGPLSLHFTEDGSPPQKGDTAVSPLGIPTFEFDHSYYLGQTKPGFASWLGELTLQDTHRNLRVHRICSKLCDTLFNVVFIKSGLSLVGIDVFETYQSVRLVNKGQPRTSF